MIKFLIKLIFWILLISLFVLGGYFLNNTFFETRDVDFDKYSFSVSSGMTLRDVAILLEEDEIVNSQNSIILQNQFNPIDNLQVGDYELDVPASPENIISQVLNQSNEISDFNKENLVGGTKVLIREGLTVDQISLILESNLNISKNEFTAFVQPFNQELKSKYSFLPDSLDCTYGNIADCPKYYLEGYLYPDTYFFKEDLDVQGIVEKMLDNFETRVMQDLPQNKTTLSFHQIITLASLVEKETGRPIEGVNESNIGQLNEERRSVARVLINRVDAGMRLSSDPSIGYWTGQTVCQQTLEIDNCIGINDVSTDHVLNTYNITGLPPAPITSPQVDVINAAMNPSDNNYLFFVSDKFGKKYFGVDYNAHLQNIANVQIINNN